uniref:Cytochrome P450 71A1 n=1 Tax=Anthurium amnicola TaxID=1678845 RepID=A0A1D1XU88_9ARAE
MYLQLGRVPTVVVSSAQMAEEVLKTQDTKFCSRPNTTTTKRISYGFSDVVFSSYNSTWRELRKMTVSTLLNNRMVEGFRPVREEEIYRMIGSISSQLASLPSEPVNLSKLLHSLSSGIVCRTAFGKRFDREGQGHGRFHEILMETQALCVEFFVGDYFPWFGWVDSLSGMRARLEKNFTELDTFYREVIQSHADPATPEDDEEDLVDVLLRLRKECHVTEDNVKGVIMVSGLF